MDLIAVVVIFAVLLGAVALVSAPLRSGRTQPLTGADDAEREELEAAKDAKYREIRDAELDFRTGKLSEEDFRVTDRQLRGEAVEILRRLDELSG